MTLRRTALFLLTIAFFCVGASVALGDDYSQAYYQATYSTNTSGGSTSSLSTSPYSQAYYESAYSTTPYAQAYYQAYYQSYYQSTYTTTTSGSNTDTTAPVISSVEVRDIHTSDANVRWSTDDHATSRVMYIGPDGKSLVSEDRCDSGGYVTSHCVHLTGLLASSKYLFKVFSVNEAGLASYSQDSTFITLSPTLTVSGTSGSSATTDTTAPVISDVHAENISAADARIRWNTDEPSDSRVAYGASYGYFLFSSQRCDGGGLVTSHCVYISALEPNTKYYYKVESRNTVLLDAESSGYAFTSGTSNTGTVSTEPVTLNSNLSTTQAIIQPNDSATRDLQTTTTPLPTVDPTATTEDLEYVNAALRALQQETKSVETNVQQTITRDIQPAMTQVPEDSQLRQQLDAQKDQLAEALGTVIRASGQVSEADLQSGLTSSLKQIQQLIKSETGVTVDLSPTARKVTEVVQEKAPDIAAAQQELLKRDGLDLYEDTDLDGVSDYDEVHIYKTNPHSAYTGGSSLTDGERILLGFDVHSSSTTRVPVESPKTSGPVTSNLYEVYSIEVQKVPIASNANMPVTTSSPAKAPALPSFDEKITFSGRALPNSFVTLYVFSTPIVVTVKTDLSGSWKYTLDSELEDGSHELYVATVDAGGKILAKSPALPFVKTAEAAEYTPLLIGQTTTDPLDVLRDNMFLIAIAGFAIVGVAALMILGGRREQAKDSEKYEVPVS